MPETPNTIKEGLTLKLALPLNVACLLCLACKQHYNSYVSQTLEGPCYYDMEREIINSWNVDASTIVEVLGRDGFKDLYADEVTYLKHVIEAIGDTNVEVTLLNRFAELPFLHPMLDEFAGQLQCAIEARHELLDEELSESSSPAAEHQMHVANLVAWRIQSESIVRALKTRGCIKNSKRLSKALQYIDAIWKLDLGSTYQKELDRAVATHFTEDTSAGR